MPFTVQILHVTLRNCSELFMYGFTLKIKMSVSAKALPTGFLKESAFTKQMLIYLFQQTKVFNCGLNASSKLKAFERILYGKKFSRIKTFVVFSHSLMTTKFS